jgi:hypothetical protein
MLTKIYKSEWLPVFGQSFILIELGNCGQAGRFGNIVTVTFCGDRKNTEVACLAVSADLPPEFFSDETILEDMALIGQNGVKNQGYELGKKMRLDWMAYLPDLSFSESNINSFLLALTYYRAFDILRDVKFRSDGDLAKNLFRLHAAKDRWSIKME